MFYKDYKFIGSRRPYDYPDSASFKKAYHVENQNELNTNVAPQFTDFSEMAYNTQDKTDYSMQGFKVGGAGMGTLSTNNKLIALAGLSIIVYFILKANVKDYSNKRAKGLA